MEHQAEDGIAVFRRGGFLEMLEAVEFDVKRMRPPPGFPLPPPHAVGSCAPPPPCGGRMLCFATADARNAAGGGGGGETFTTITTGTTTSSTSSSSSNSGRSKHKAESGGGRAAGSAPKKPRKQKSAGDGSSNGGSTGRARREKIGDRIITLQQLVSPFGKSDTASVLHEALGYIKFLHDQVQVLSSPYLQQQLPPQPSPPNSALCHHGPRRGDLRSRGLCLVPLSCTTQLESSSNGADLWSAVSRQQ